MSRRARTLPTPGSDSSTLTTFSLASMSSLSLCSNRSREAERFSLSRALTSARTAARFRSFLERGLALLGGERRRERHREATSGGDPDAV